MKITTYNSYNNICQIIADTIVKEIHLKPNLTLGLATGDTFKEVYNQLIYYFQKKIVDFSKINTINLDEYIGNISYFNTYKYYMINNLFKHINIDISNTYIPSGTNDNNNNILEFKEILKKYPIDIQLLGVGLNGHIGFNEPNTKLHADVHITDLSATTIKSNARFFDSEAHVPKKAITMGIGDILKANKIILLCDNINKIKAIKHLLRDDLIYYKWPITMLKLHNNLEIYINNNIFRKIHNIYY